MAALNNAPSSQSGFTLLELIVVVAIIGVLAGALVLTLSWGSLGRLQQETDRLQQSLQMAGDIAVMEGAETGCALTQGGYRFLRYDAPSHAWQKLDGAMGEHRLPEGMVLRLTSGAIPVMLPADEKQEGKMQPVLVFFPSGEMTPFSLSLSGASGKTLTLITDGLSAITSEQEPAP